MNTRPLRILLTVLTTVFVLVCVLFFLNRVGTGLLPDGLGSWLGGNEWAMWTSAAVAVISGLGVSLLSLNERDED
ncbi:hypothetical protein [Actinoalloteichus hymeniacidonis]|uniref:Uncharacterized protein n=1 Tax=Actinoalloteichus hymeniacidonis TaxID=340345 RepID=A0AAC9HM91_9PSEU|nr:hypothetical protein [Actinoalloteichus hymeniacidonis]AOS61927.1 hypothetical protein TL08_05500 [Actinoalloteichus hymeniacidonis]MBB5910053.1 hypothetical protein [Actinoalloteichus hymeniacidonis]